MTGERWCRFATHRPTRGGLAGVAVALCAGVVSVPAAGDLSVPETNRAAPPTAQSVSAPATAISRPLRLAWPELVLPNSSIVPDPFFGTRESSSWRRDVHRR